MMREYFWIIGVKLDNNDVAITFKSTVSRKPGEHFMFLGYEWITDDCYAV